MPASQFLAKPQAAVIQHSSFILQHFLLCPTTTKSPSSRRKHFPALRRSPRAQADLPDRRADGRLGRLPAPVAANRRLVRLRSSPRKRRSKCNRRDFVEEKHAHELHPCRRFCRDHRRLGTGHAFAARSARRTGRDRSARAAAGDRYGRGRRRKSENDRKRRPLHRGRCRLEPACRGSFRRAAAGRHDPGRRRPALDDPRSATRALGARWRCRTRELSIAFGLEDTIDVLKAEYSKSESGAVETSWTVFSEGVRGRIQPLETLVAAENSAEASVRRCRIMLEESFDLDHTNRLRGPGGVLYRIVSAAGFPKLGELQTVEVERI